MFIRQGFLPFCLLFVFMACDTRPDKSHRPPPVAMGNPVPPPPSSPPPPPMSDKPVSFAGVEVNVTCSCMGPQFTRDTYQSVDGKNKSVSVQSVAAGGALAVQQAYASCEEKSKNAWWRYFSGPGQKVNLLGCTALITAKPQNVVAVKCACTISGSPQTGSGGADAAVIGVGLNPEQALHDSKMACELYRKGYKIPSQCRTVLPEGYEQNPPPPTHSLSERDEEDSSSHTGPPVNGDSPFQASPDPPPTF